MKRRRNSRSGISIFYALLFLMVASMVAVVILDAAVTATRRVRDEQRAQQATLTLASGGKLIREMLEQSSVTISTSTDEFGIETKTYQGYGPLGELLGEAVDKVDRLNTTFRSADEHRNIVIEVSMPEEPEEMFEVKMEFEMVKEKNALEGDVTNLLPFVITGTITASDTSQSDEKLTLVAYAISNESGTEKHYRWQVSKLEGGGA